MDSISDRHLAAQIKPLHTNEKNRQTIQGSSNASKLIGHAQTLSRYKYDPLLDSSTQVRLVKLPPGHFQDEVKVEITTTCLTRDSIPKYEALSYTWGDISDTIDIKVGPNGEQDLAVTKSLSQALRYLRYETEARVMWIDAICVDQKNFTERSSQVQRMADIYTLAERVIIWLGPEGQDSSLALKSLRDLSNRISVLTVMGDYTEIKPSRRWIDEPHWADRSTRLPWSNEQLWALHHLIIRPWFERLWIWYVSWD